MARYATVGVRVDFAELTKFRKECQRATAALEKLYEIRAEMLWECSQCGGSNDFNGKTCKGCGATR